MNVGFLPAVLVGAICALLNASAQTTLLVILVVVVLKSLIEIRYTKGSRFGRYVGTARRTRVRPWAVYLALSLVTEIPLGLIAFYLTRLLTRSDSL